MSAASQPAPSSPPQTIILNNISNKTHTHELIYKKHNDKKKKKRSAFLEIKFCWRKIHNYKCTREFFETFETGARKGDRESGL